MSGLKGGVKGSTAVCRVRFEMKLCYIGTELMARDVFGVGSPDRRLLCAGVEQEDPSAAGQEQNLPCGLWSRHLHLLG